MSSYRSAKPLRTTLGVSAAAHLVGAGLIAVLWPAPDPVAAEPETIVMLEEIDAPEDTVPEEVPEDPVTEPEPEPEVKPELTDEPVEELAALVPPAPLPVEIPPEPKEVAPPVAGSAPPEPLAVRDDDAADALAGLDPGKGEGIGPGESPGKGAGPTGEIDLFPEDILRAWVEKGLPRRAKKKRSRRCSIATSPR